MALLPIEEDIVEFVNVGVPGFIMKDATPDDLVTTIRSVADGAHVLPPQRLVQRSRSMDSAGEY
ncbi:MAG: hypothetical protein ABI647_13100 [Gemmatimonadota bacterium]